MTPARHGRAPAPPALLPDTAGGQLALGFDQRQFDIAAIWQATGVYTAEIEALLDRLGWPVQGDWLLDPGAGNGGFLVAALARLDLARDDVAEAGRRVRGFEFIGMLNDPAVQAQADALALRVEGGYASYTATLLRQLVIPRHHIAQAAPPRPPR